MNDRTTPPEKKITIVGICSNMDESDELRDILAEKDDYHVTGVFISGKAALVACKDTVPDIFIVDRSADDLGDSIVFLKSLIDLYPSSKIIVAERTSDAEYLREVMLLGIRGFTSAPYSYSKQHLFDTINYFASNQ
jgi:DNA-binding NarL/FixJ family response regulator